MSFFSNLKQGIQTDDTIRKIKKYGRRAARAFPHAAPKYLLAKVPVVSWLPRYSPGWILNDVIAGVTMGVLLIPQALAYAKIATIPPQFGLITSFSPSLVYFFMGTSKDVSIGPTSIAALLTSQIIKDLKGEGYQPEVIAAGVAFSVAHYCWILGLLQLGWLLDFVSLPVLTGFISAAALVIISGQIPPLFGLTASPDGEASLIHNFFHDLPKTQGPTIAVGLTGIILLVFFQKVGLAWGRQYKFIWIISILRNAIVLVLFTTISYFLNKDLKVPVFPLSSTVNAGLVAPRLPDVQLLIILPVRAFPVFIAAALEHLAIGKAFGRRNGYTIDQAQELTALGTTNFISSLFGGMAVSGAISRTSVNSESGVKSPLSGLVTTAMVLLSIYKLTGVLFWIPKATLSAIIVTAVWQIVVPLPVFIKYWRTSLADFVGSQLAFWLTLFVSAEVGIEAAVGFGFLYTLIRIAFARTTLITDKNREFHYPTSHDEEQNQRKDSYSINNLPPDTKLFKFNESILFPNAEKNRDNIMESIQTYSLPSLNTPQKPRIWSDAHDRKIADLRKTAKINELDLPRIRVIILDLNNVAFIDTTGLQALADLKAELIGWVGIDLELRFVALRKGVRSRFERIGWTLTDAWGVEEVPEDLRGDLVFEAVDEAVRWVGDGRDRGSVVSIGSLSSYARSTSARSEGSVGIAVGMGEKEVRYTESALSQSTR